MHRNKKKKLKNELFFLNQAVILNSKGFFTRSQFCYQIWYSLSSERLVDIKITKFYAEKVVPSARKI
jgi:hypothetical protein